MSASKPATLEERLAVAIARLLRNPSAPPVRHAAIGAASAIPAAACSLAKMLSEPIRISFLQRPRANPFTDGTRELFDLAGQGRIDLFFLGGGQIDGQANINLIGTGDWPGRLVRFPGSFGSAFMYFMVPRTILFRVEHTPRVFVPKVDIVSAPGLSPPNVFRRGTAEALVTGRSVFRFDQARGRFMLASVHPGESRDSIRAATGFDYDEPQNLPQTADPTDAELTLLRGPVADEMVEAYPEFCRRVWGRGASTQPEKAA